ncbi:MAG: SprB repeat-containing protein, partial [Bacteroidota bacterium]
MNVRILLLLTAAISLIACEGDNPGPGCNGSLKVEVASIVDASCGDNSGSINLSASGGDGTYSFSLDGGTAQGSTTFADISQGDYTLTVTDGEGCTANVQAEVKTGLSLSDIKPIITTSCAIQNCHNGDRANLPNFSIDANIISGASGIKTRTSNETMP